MSAGLRKVEEKSVSKVDFAIMNTIAQSAWDHHKEAGEMNCPQLHCEGVDCDVQTTRIHLKTLPQATRHFFD